MNHGINGVAVNLTPLSGGGVLQPQLHHRLNAVTNCIAWACMGMYSDWARERLNVNDKADGVLVSYLFIYLIIKAKGHTGHLHCSKTYT